MSKRVRGNHHHYQNYFFQVTDEMNLIWKADIKVDSQEFSYVNDDQGIYDGMRWIIICSSIVLMMHRCYWCFYNLYHNYIFFPIKYRSLYSIVFDAFFFMQIKWYPSVMKFT